MGVGAARLLVVLGAAVAPATGLSSAEASVMSLSCTPAALAAAVPKGGDYRLGCDKTITLSRQLVISRGQRVSITGSGHSTISGGRRVRLFEVKRGALGLSGITLTDGYTRGLPGREGTGGATGADGDPGSAGMEGAPNGT